jgi:hypothetical protein
LDGKPNRKFAIARNWHARRKDFFHAIELGQIMFQLLARPDQLDGMPASHQFVHNPAQGHGHTIDLWWKGLGHNGNAQSGWLLGEGLNQQFIVNVHGGQHKVQK